MDYVSYIRVSTKNQGISGLGLEGQRQSIADHVQRTGGRVIAEYQDISSGRKDCRPGLSRAIHHAKQAKATLVFAKLDRVSRKVSFIANLMESGIKFVVAEFPSADHFQLHVYAALAQQERRMISERTKTALAAAKARGIQLGKNGKNLAAANKQASFKFIQTVQGELLPLWGQGMSYRGIAKTLNDKNVKSFTGGMWHTETVKRALEKALFNLSSFPPVSATTAL